MFTLKQSTLCDTHDAIACDCLNPVVDDNSEADHVNSILTGDDQILKTAAQYLRQFKHSADVSTCCDSVLKALPADVASVICYTLSYLN